MKKKHATLISLCLIISMSISLFAQKDKNRIMKHFYLDYGFSTRTILQNPNISYIDTGKGNSTIVLIHGLGSNAGFWRYNIHALAKNKRVIAIDLPGYGKSQKDDYPYSMTFYSNEIKKIIDKLNIDKIDLVGHSMGGQIAITFALQYPDKIHKLILISPAGIEFFNRTQSNILAKFLSVDAVKSLNRKGIEFNIKNNFYKWDSKFNWLIKERNEMKNSADFDGYARAVVKSVEGMLNEPTSQKLKNLSVSTLIIFGKNDNLIPNKYFHNLKPSDLFLEGAKEIKNCKLQGIKNAGHLVYIEKSNEVNSIILNFLNN